MGLRPTLDAGADPNAEASIYVRLTDPNGQKADEITGIRWLYVSDYNQLEELAEGKGWVCVANTEDFEKLENSLQRGCSVQGRGAMHEDLMHSQNPLPDHSGVIAAYDNTEGVFSQGLCTKLSLGGVGLTGGCWGAPTSPPRIRGKWITKQSASSPVTPLELPCSPSTPLLNKLRGSAAMQPTLDEELGVTSDLKMVLNLVGRLRWRGSNWDGKLFLSEREPTGMETDSFFNVYPFYRQLRQILAVERSDWKVATCKDNNTTFKLKVGLIGFGSIGRQVAEALFEIKEADLIAICDSSTVAEMAIAWKSSKVSLSVTGESSLMFMKQTTEFGKNVGVLVSVLNPRQHEESPWGNILVNYVIDTLSLFSEDKHFVYSAHDRADPPCTDGRTDTDLPKQLPKSLPGTVYTMMYADERVPSGFNPSVKYLKVMVNSEAVKKSIVENLPEWKGVSANICFYAETNPTKRLCDPLTELLSSNEEQEADEENEPGDRLISVLTCCIRILKSVAIGGIFLMF
ncbi:Glyceraldehyde-3-phosphate dehydrogenase [Triticum urartu]|uniref:Glyceraldehyde-3-phosphate dehydrogenase n=1 Tax=Triticum urartu TaxID=4572 RepID=M8A8K1_TRIUA|nr:Glyceraldehyde-3-phosphate dehydrogenase [Triticum urartu]